MGDWRLFIASITDSKLCRGSIFVAPKKKAHNFSLIPALNHRAIYITYVSVGAVFLQDGLVKLPHVSHYTVACILYLPYEWKQLMLSLHTPQMRW